MGFISSNFSIIAKGNYKGSIIPKDNYHGDPNQLDLGEGHMAKGHGKGPYFKSINKDKLINFRQGVGR